MYIISRWQCFMLVEISKIYMLFGLRRSFLYSIMPVRVDYVFV